MGCGASAPVQVPEGPDDASTVSSGKQFREDDGGGGGGGGGGGPPSFGMLKRSTKASSKHSSDREKSARLALAASVKRQCGYVPIFYIRSQFDSYDTDRSGFLEASVAPRLRPRLASIFVSRFIFRACTPHFILHTRFAQGFDAAKTDERRIHQSIHVH